MGERRESFFTIELGKGRGARKRVTREVVELSLRLFGLSKGGTEIPLEDPRKGDEDTKGGRGSAAAHKKRNDLGESRSRN